MKVQRTFTSSTNSIFFLTDHLGAPQRALNSSGMEVWGVVQEAFGRAETLSGSSAGSNLRFSSQYLDSESGLHWNTMRYYQAGVGRYSRRDPILDRYFILRSVLVFSEKTVNGYHYSNTDVGTWKLKGFRDVVLAPVMLPRPGTKGIDQFTGYVFAGNAGFSSQDPLGLMSVVTIGGPIIAVAGYANCISSFYRYAYDNYGWPEHSDKFRHCWTTCKASSWCTGGGPLGSLPTGMILPLVTGFLYEACGGVAHYAHWPWLQDICPWEDFHAALADMGANSVGAACGVIPFRSCKCCCEDMEVGFAWKTR